MRVQPIDLMLSSSSPGNASIAQFSLDVGEVLQARELPQKQTVVFFIFLVLENTICHFYGSFKVPSPQHCVGQLGAQGSLLTLFLGCSPWALTFGRPIPMCSRTAVPVLSATSSAPWSSRCNGDVLGQLQMLLMCMGSAHEVAEQTTEGLLTRELTPGIPWLDSASLKSPSWGPSFNQINLSVGQWGITVTLKFWRLMEICPHGVYNF